MGYFVDRRLAIPLVKDIASRSGQVKVNRNESE